MTSLYHRYAWSVILFVLEVFGFSQGMADYKIHELRWKLLSLSCIIILTFYQKFLAHWWQTYNQFIKVSSQISSVYLGGPNTSLTLCISLFFFNGYRKGPSVRQTHLVAAWLLNQLEDFELHFISMRPQTQRPQTDL